MNNDIFDMEINVTLRQANGYGGQLTISERMQLQANNFLELCSILGEFHKLSETLKTVKES